MSETYQINAIILDRRPYRDFDTLVTLYCPEKGKLELAARGAKRPKSKLAGHLEPLNLTAVMVVPGRHRDYAGSADSKDCFINVKSDFSKAVSAGRAVGLIKNFLKTNEPDSGIYFLLKDYLKILDKPDFKDYDFLAAAFLLKFLTLSGYEPRLDNCAICGKAAGAADGNFFRDGLVCAVCARSQKIVPLPISSDCANLLKLIVKNKLSFIINSKFKKQAIEQAGRLISGFWKYATE